MSGTSVVFYGIQTDFFAVAYKLIEKMYALGERVLFLCDSEDEVNFYNSKLWTTAQLSFIPSGNKQTILPEDAKFCYVWFATEITFLNNPTCLLHNGIDISNMSGLNRFQKIVDIFNLDAMDDAKSRAQFYQGNGFTDQKFWLQDNGTWKQGILE